MNQGQDTHEPQHQPYQAPRIDMDDMMGADYAPGQWQDPAGQLHADVGKFMGIVFAWMSAAVAVTALAIWAVVSSPAAIEFIYGFDVTTGTRTGSGAQMLFLFAPLVLVMIVGKRINGMAPGLAGGMLMIYAALVGVSISYVPLVYDAGSIVGCFAVAAGMFAVMAAIGFFTKKDLTGVGRFLSMAVVGLMIAWLVSLAFPAVYFWVSAIGVFIFAGLTAKDTQEIKQMYMLHGGRGNLAVVGALMLYISLVNMFLFLLYLFGGRD